MQYDPGSEKVAVTSIGYLPITQQLHVTEDPQIRRTRKRFLIILGVLLGLSILSGISVISQSDTVYSTLGTSRGTQIAEYLVSILFYAFGIFVTYRYSTIGLRVFAWLTIIILIVSAIVIIFLICAAGLALNAANSGTNDEIQSISAGLSKLIVLLSIVGLASFILLIIVVIFAFKLASLIENKKAIIAQSV